MKFCALTAADFISKLETVESHQGHLFLDTIQEPESFVVLFYNIDIGERIAYRLPALCRDDVLSYLSRRWPQVSFESRIENARDDEVNLGPYHPLLQGDIRPIVHMEGESVKSVRFQSGYRYLGLEGRLLKEGLEQGAFLCSHLNPEQGPVTNTLWCYALESLGQVEIPNRAKIIRMLFLELARMRSHVLFFKKMSELLGLDILACRCKEQLQYLKKIYRDYGLSYAHPFLSIPGGLFVDMPEDWPLELKAYLNVFEKFVDGVSRDLLHSRFVFDRCSISSFTGYEGLESSLTGPILRSSGIRLDNRKKKPFYFYQELDFEIPLGSRGTVFERMVVRCEELVQSLKILRQICNFIPVGESLVPFELKASGSFYAALEAPEGELGLYLAIGNGELQTLKFRSPSRSHLCFAGMQASGSNLSDFLVNYCSFNISASELDA